MAVHLNHIVAEFGTAPLRGLHFDMTKAAWRHLQKLLPLVQSMGTTHGGFPMLPENLLPWYYFDREAPPFAWNQSDTCRRITFNAGMLDSPR